MGWDGMEYEMKWNTFVNYNRNVSSSSLVSCLPPKDQGAQQRQAAGDRRTATGRVVLLVALSVRPSVRHT